MIGDIRSDKHDQEREQKLLIPWITTCLDENRFRDFRWHDQKKKVFQVPWSHKSANHWSPECVQVPAAWAAFKGKYDGERKEDFKRLKSTFRCALNSRKELVLLKKTNKFRFWKILPERHVALAEKKERSRKARTKSSCSVQNKKSVPFSRKYAEAKSHSNAMESREAYKKTETAKSRGRPRKNRHMIEATTAAAEFDVGNSTLVSLSSTDNPVIEAGLCTTQPSPVTMKINDTILPPFDVWRRSPETYFPPSPPEDENPWVTRTVPSLSFPGLLSCDTVSRARAVPFCSDTDDCSQKSYIASNCNQTVTPPSEDIEALLKMGNPLNMLENDLLTESWFPLDDYVY